MGTIRFPPVGGCVGRGFGKLYSWGEERGSHYRHNPGHCAFCSRLESAAGPQITRSVAAAPQSSVQTEPLAAKSGKSGGPNRTSRTSTRSASPAMASTDRHHLAQYPAAQTDLGWGAGLWDYRKVPEPALTSLLAAVAKSNTIGTVDIVDFQPQTNQPSEDRHIVQDWVLQNGTWKLLAVFDGR